jgi:hypothetical protein
MMSEYNMRYIEKKLMLREQKEKGKKLIHKELNDLWYFLDTYYPTIRDEFEGYMNKAKKENNDDSRRTI